MKKGILTQLKSLADIKKERRIAGKKEYIERCESLVTIAEEGLIKKPLTLIKGIYIHSRCPLCQSVLKRTYVTMSSSMATDLYHYECQNNNCDYEYATYQPCGWF